MSVVAIRCPTCGSVANSTTTANEYQCSHSQSRFQIIRPADGVVISDSRAHHCPICGRAVQTTQSFKCTECGRVDFCKSCVTSIPILGAERFVCRACMAIKGWACSSCGGYATLVCINCRRRACGEHTVGFFALQHVKGAETIRVEYFTCTSCKGQLCNSCIEKKSGIFSTKYLCRRCNTELEAASTPNRVCKSCGHTAGAPSAFCTTCGKALS
jgi:DNA-directed RNA polymerase subunit RPC12/RpoP